MLSIQDNESIGNHPRPPCLHEKLRKNVHEKCTPLSLFSIYTRIRTRIQTHVHVRLAFSSSHSTTVTHTRTQARESQGLSHHSLPLRSPLSRSSPMHETKFLETSRRISKQLCKKPRADSRMEAKHSEMTTRRRAF